MVRVVEDRYPLFNAWTPSDVDVKASGCTILTSNVRPAHTTTTFTLRRYALVSEMVIPGGNPHAWCLVHFSAALKRPSWKCVGVKARRLAELSSYFVSVRDLVYEKTSARKDLMVTAGLRGAVDCLGRCSRRTEKSRRFLGNSMTEGWVMMRLKQETGSSEERKMDLALSLMVSWRPACCGRSWRLLTSSIHVVLYDAAALVILKQSFRRFLISFADIQD